MQKGELWGYRERIGDPTCPLINVEIIQFGPPTTQKVKVRMVSGEYPGLDVWIPKARLRVPWVEAEVWLRDERLFNAAREASLHVLDTVEHNAAFLCIGCCPREDVYLGWQTRDGATIRIENLAEAASELGLKVRELLDEPLAFVDRKGEYVGPWKVAKRLAKIVAERYADRVLSEVAKEESKLQHEAVYGYTFEWSKKESSYVPPERCAEYLLKRQPVFNLVRSWCHILAVEKFNEVEMLRSEVKRLQALTEDAAKQLDQNGLKNAAGRLRRKMERVMQ